MRYPGWRCWWDTRTCRANAVFNAASLIRAGRVEATYFKMRLPNYEVFDEERYFDEGSDPLVFEVAGVRVGVNICADVWEPGDPEAAAAAGAQVLAVLMHRPGTWTSRSRASRCWPIASRQPAFRRCTPQSGRRTG